MPSMKTLTFGIMTSLIMGIEQEEKQKLLVELFQQLIKGFLSVPVDLPFTSFNRCLKARLKIKTIVMDLIREKRAALESQTAFSQQDLVTSLLSLRNEDNSMVLSDEEIADNALITMVAGYDTTSILLSCLIKLLANDEAVCARIVQGKQLKCFNLTQMEKYYGANSL